MMITGTYFFFAQQPPILLAAPHHLVSQLLGLVPNGPKSPHTVDNLAKARLTPSPKWETTNRLFKTWFSCCSSFGPQVLGGLTRPIHRSNRTTGLQTSLQTKHIVRKNG